MHVLAMSKKYKQIAFCKRKKNDIPSWEKMNEWMKNWKAYEKL